MRNPALMLLLTSSLVFGVLAKAEADIVISMSFAEESVVSNNAIAVGVNFVDVYLHFDANDGPRGNDAGSFFDGFTYVVEASNTGVAVAAFDKPISQSNLNPLMQTQNWAIADDSGAGAPNQLAGNVNAPGGSGLKSPFDGFVMKYSLDTSQLVVGDLVTFDPNLFGAASVSDGANNFGGSSNYVINVAQLSVTSAVPEPSGLVPAMLLSLVGVSYRSRRRI